MTNTSNSSGSVGPMFLLFLTFLVLKLTGVVTWSWWWITAPLWGGLAFLIVTGGLVAIVWGLVLWVTTWRIGRKMRAPKSSTGYKEFCKRASRREL